ncbi:glycosyltransferase [uncultured Paludibaculum sp.]|uniref:glycosyltransferase n=1 Tax=uncultured Paludibaculum sp. TaxID=1765020 RepID=UPI002AABBFC3|nr:glycosyltransferase [uncultured Paludibaculum sp.]
MIPRVAFFTDSFHEVNGVALTSRSLHEFARRRAYPFLSVHFAPSASFTRDGEFWTAEFARSAWRLGLERDLSFDLLCPRHKQRMAELLREFEPDVIHATGPGDAGMLAAWLAYDLKVPLVLSWHTNVHEYAGRRLRRMLRGVPAGLVNHADVWGERAALSLSCRFYQLARVLLAPTPELCTLLHQRTGRPVRLMTRGSDTVGFGPSFRVRRDDDGQVVLGFVGRLSPEKNVRLLARVEDALERVMPGRYSFLIVGDGSERAWLEARLRRATFTGILRGQALAQAYADMDVFVFPSETDTYGNVVVEAMASGVPAVVTGRGGPKFLVRPGETGLIGHGAEEFIEQVMRLAGEDALRRTMRSAARSFAESQSWDRVFEGVYAAYGEALQGATVEERSVRGPGPAAVFDEI